MARYIDEENLIRRMHTMAKDKNYPPYADIFKSFAFKAFKDLLMSEPTADVQEVKHAHWEKLANGYGYVCSNCRVREKRSAVFNGTHKFCYKCGAKMDGKEN